MVIQRGDSFTPLATVLSGSRNFIDMRTVYGNAPVDTTTFSGGTMNSSGELNFLNGYVYQYTAVDDTQPHCFQI